ncbi:MAG: hypothetical protein FWG75_10040 [Cystobacterineae bacterium]|nr:hypothetical protein [Cystobacterineae bacterium]
MLLGSYLGLQGELYRRIREFDKASQVFSALKSELKDSVDAESVISQQLELIAQKNSSPQLMR